MASGTATADAQSKPGSPYGESPARIAPANLQDEYVVAGPLNWYGAALQSLPWGIDDLTNDFGDDLYERMLRDPQVYASMIIWKSSILEDGLTLSSPIEEASDPDYDTARLLAQAAQEMIDNLDTPLDDVLWNMMDAAAFGNKVAELVWRMDDTADGPRLNLAAIKPKPRRMTEFVVDRYNNIVGMLAAQSNLPLPYAAGGRVYNPDTKSMLPREKFAILTFRPVDNDPRGTSFLRAAYDPWFRKRQVLVEYVKYVAQFAGPSVIVKSPQDADSIPAVDSLGNIIPGAAALTPEQALANAFTAWGNSKVVAVPFGTEVDLVQSTGEGRAHLSALTHCDQQIVISILTQTLATMEAEHQARAAAQVHEDVLETLIRQGKKSVIRMFVRDILRNWVSYNWGPAMLPLTPKATLGTTEKRQQPAVMAAIAQLTTAGYIQEDQLTGIDLLLGLPPRDSSLGTAPAFAPPAAPEPPPSPEPTPTDQGTGDQGANAPAGEGATSGAA